MTRCTLLDQWFDSESKQDKEEEKQKKDLITGDKNELERRRLVEAEPKSWMMMSHLKRKAQSPTTLIWTRMATPKNR